MPENGRSPRASVSRFGIVLTLLMRRKEGHLAYRSQSEPPRGRGTTLGGSTDDPGRQRTRNAPARDTACAGPGQRRGGLPRAGHLAHAVLPLAAALRAVRQRRCPPAAAARPAGPAGAGLARSRAADSQRRDQHGDMGVRADCRLCPAHVAGACRPEHRAARIATRGPGDSAGTPDSSSARPRGQRVCLPSARGSACGALAMAARAISRRGIPATWSVSTPSTSATSRASARFGRSPRATRRAPTARRGCCRRTRPRMPRRFCVTSSCHSIAARAGRCGGSSRTVARSSRAPSRRRADSLASATRGPSRGMRGPTALSNGCRARFCRSTGGSRFADATSPAVARCSGRWMSLSATTTTIDRTRVIACGAERRRHSSGVPFTREAMSHSGSAKVSTPFRAWTH
jgi:hypothetical protein